MALSRVVTAHDPAIEVPGIRGMLGGTTVLTLEGALPVEFLEPGDRVLTRMGARRISRIEVTVVRQARVIRIAADTFGVGKPQDAVTLAPAQGILVRDWRARALYGAAQVVVPAGRLSDGFLARSAVLAEARLYVLGFEEPAVIYAGGLELACEGPRVRA